MEPSLDSVVNLGSCLKPKLIFEDERGMPDFIGDGECCVVAEFLLTVSGVKFTCLTILPTSAPGVEGIEGSGFSRLGRVGLLVKEGIEDGFVTGFVTDFLALKLGCRRIDLTRSNLPGLPIELRGSDLTMLLKLLVIADLVKPRGVPATDKFGLDGDFDRVGICVFFVFAARDKEA